MSNFSGDKGARMTVNEGQYRRQRLSPGIEREPQIGHAGTPSRHQYVGQPSRSIGPSKFPLVREEAGNNNNEDGGPGLHAGYESTYPAIQPYNSNGLSNQENVNGQEDVESIELEIREIQAQRRLSRARHQARQQVAQSQGHLSQRTGVLQHFLDHQSLQIPNHGHAPIKPYGSGHSQATASAARISRAPNSALSSSTYGGNPATQSSLQSAPPSLGKRHRDAREEIREEECFHDGRAPQRRKTLGSQFASGGQSSMHPSRYDRPSINEELPSSDGLDLLGLHPSPRESSYLQPYSGHHVPLGDLYQPTSMTADVDTSVNPFRAHDEYQSPELNDPSSDFSLLQPLIATGFGGRDSNAQALPAATPIESSQHGANNVPFHGFQKASPNNTTQYLGKRPRMNFEEPGLNQSDQNETTSAADEPQTKRQKRIQRFGKKGIELGVDNKKKGTVQYDSHGNMLYMLKGSLVPAAYHHERRDVLLAKAERFGQYSYLSEQGAGEYDRMAFHPRYADVDMKRREMRPEVLYQWNSTKEKTASQDPGYMYDEADGKLLLDVNNHAIRNWPELPLTISGQVEGMWMELWRRINPQISLPDIIARCPKTTQKHAGAKQHELSIAAFGNRMRRHRVLVGTRAWEEREGSVEIGNRLKEVMPRRVLDQIESDNSTKAWRDLTNDEVDAILNVNKGKGSAPARAGNKKLPDDVKQARDAALNGKIQGTLQRLMNEKRKDDEQYEATLPQELSDLQDESFEGSTFVEPPLEEEGTTFVDEADNTPPSTMRKEVEDPKTNGNESVIETANCLHTEVDSNRQLPTDFAFQQPTIEAERTAIGSALEVTLNDYRRITGHYPPMSNGSTSLVQQCQELQGALNQWWWSKHGTESRAPILATRYAWIGGWDAWEVAPVTSTQYEYSQNPESSGDLAYVRLEIQDMLGEIGTQNTSGGQSVPAEEPTSGLHIDAAQDQNGAATSSHLLASSESGNRFVPNELPEMPDDTNAELDTHPPSNLATTGTEALLTEEQTPLGSLDDLFEDPAIDTTPEIPNTEKGFFPNDSTSDNPAPAHSNPIPDIDLSQFIWDSFDQPASEGAVPTEPPTQPTTLSSTPYPTSIATQPPTPQNGTTKHHAAAATQPYELNYFDHFQLPENEGNGWEFLDWQEPDVSREELEGMFGSTA
ncbi:MAG: hypothetical protein Q9219_002701 [cf. Caloplaca sp. 3 TL-2023]